MRYGGAGTVSRRWSGKEPYPASPQAVSKGTLAPALQARLWALGADLTRRNPGIGGSTDLLVMTWFLQKFPAKPKKVTFL